MSIDWSKAVKDYYDQQPHPNGHGLKIGEYATAVKLASMLKFGGHAAGHEAALFWREFQATGMSPQEFEHALDRLAPLSFTYHGRPPTMQEMVQLKDKLPHEVRRYFGDLPDQHYPHLSAAEMVKSLHSADPHAREHLQRPANKYEAQYLHHSGENASNYYQRIAQRDNLSDNVLPLEERREARGRSSRTAGGSQADQRDPDRQWRSLRPGGEVGSAGTLGRPSSS